ncbi:MAG: hypothetical protein PHV51_01130 [Methanosarcinaceae archaeon]|nr:hypothetical protein [Methanosarcinaceae archaeon]
MSAEGYKKESKKSNARKIVGFVSWCPAVLSMILGAVLAGMYFEGEIDGLRNFYPNNFMDPEDSFYLESNLKTPGAC